MLDVVIDYFRRTIIFRLLLVSLALYFLSACSEEVGGQVNPLSTKTILATEAPLVIEQAQTEPSAEETLQELMPTLVEPALVEPTAGTNLQEIVLWHGLGDQGSLALGEIVANFQKENPQIQVNVNYIPYDDLQDHYINAVADGVGPDLLLGAGEWGPMLYDLGAVTTIPQEVLEELQLEITPPALKAVHYKESIIAMPFSLEGVVMFRNIAILPHAAKTFEELVASSQKVTKGRTIGAYLERGDNFAYAQITACKGMLIFPNGYPAFNDSSGLCWLNLLSLFEAAGPVSFNSDDDLNRFKAGHVGLIFAGTWNLGNLQEALGDNLVIDPWPAFGDSHLSGYVWTENIYLSANLTAEAYTRTLSFAEYFLSPEAQSVLAEIGIIPATLYRDVKEELIFQAVASMMKGTPYPVIPEMAFYEEPMHEVLLAVFEQNIAPSIALQQADDEITNLVEDFNDKEEDF